MHGFYLLSNNGLRLQLTQDLGLYMRTHTVSVTTNSQVEPVNDFFLNAP